MRKKCFTIETRLGTSQFPVEYFEQDMLPIPAEVAELRGKAKKQYSKEGSE